VFCLLATHSKGQEEYHRLNIGLGAGINTTYADIAAEGYGKSILFGLDYHISQYMTAGVAFEKGSFKGNSNTDPRAYTNNYSTFSFTGRLYSGEFLKSSASTFLHTIFVGSGIGILSNSISENVRLNTTTGQQYKGVDAGKDLLIPFTAGFQVPFGNAWGVKKLFLEAGAQYNLTFGEGLDGYYDPLNDSESRRLDAFGTVYLKLNYRFGRKAVSYKP